MNIQETVSKFLQPHAFFISGGGVMVKHPEDVTFLKNMLKAAGLPNLKVCYFDGKRMFSESELKSVIVVGECHDKSLVFNALDKLHANGPFTQMAYLDVYPSHLRPLDGFAVEWARQKGIATKPVRVEWKFGTNAAPIRYRKLFAKGSRTKPDTVVAFTNKEITPQVKIAQKAGVEVVFA